MLTEISTLKCFFIEQCRAESLTLKFSQFLLFSEYIFPSPKILTTKELWEKRLMLTKSACACIHVYGVFFTIEKLQTY